MKRTASILHKLASIARQLQQSIAISGHASAYRFKWTIAIAILLVAMLAMAGLTYLPAKPGGKQVIADPDQYALPRKQPDSVQKQLDLYDKLRSGADVSILVLGDRIGASAGVQSIQQTWHYQLEAALARIYGAESTIHTFATGSETILDGLVDYYIAPTADAYDLVFLCFGYEEQEHVSHQTFARAYEQLIHAVRSEKKYPEIYLMIDPRHQDEFYNQFIERFAAYYHLEVIDMKEAFAFSGLSVESLTTDGTLPNANGYLVYRGAILRTIEEQLLRNKSVYQLNKLPLQPIGTEPVVLSSFQATGGFQIADNIHWSELAGEELFLRTNMHFLGIMAYESEDSGIVDVYVNDRQLAEIDLYGPNRVSIHWLSASLMTDNADEITLRVSGRKHRDSAGTKVGIIGVVAN